MQFCELRSQMYYHNKYNILRNPIDIEFLLSLFSLGSRNSEEFIALYRVQILVPRCALDLTTI